MFISIDGTDGSGKKTQTELLVKKLEATGHPVFKIDFPQYGHKSAGLVEEYLNGKYGTAEVVTPYQASILYAADRFDMKFRIIKELNAGKIIVADRYVSSNMGHQGGKIEDAGERQKFFNWLYDLEYNIFQIPKPDLNLILHVPHEITAKLIADRVGEKDASRLSKDIHEADKKHLQMAEKTYLDIASGFPDFTLIECCENNEIMTPEKIHGIIWQVVAKKISL